MRTVQLYRRIDKTSKDAGEGLRGDQKSMKKRDSRCRGGQGPWSKSERGISGRGERVNTCRERGNGKSRRRKIRRGMDVLRRRIRRSRG